MDNLFLTSTELAITNLIIVIILGLIRYWSIYRIFQYLKKYHPSTFKMLNPSNVAFKKYIFSDFKVMRMSFQSLLTKKLFLDEKIKKLILIDRLIGYFLIVFVIYLIFILFEYIK